MNGPSYYLFGSVVFVDFTFNTSLQARLITILSDNSLHLWEVNYYEDGTRLEEVREFAMEAR